MSPLVSVCIPTFNGAKHLAKCLGSIFAQSFANYEVLIVDDCSSDDTLAIANEYASHDDRVRVLRNEKNLGLVGNWNRCVELSRGEWIKFVFQDDWIMPTCLEELLSASKDGQLMVACNRRFEFEEATAEEVTHFYFRHKELIEKLYGAKTRLSGAEYSALALQHIGGNLVGEPTVTMIHRSVFDKFGFFNPNLIMSCDLEYWTRVAAHTGISFVRTELVAFRVHQNATSAENRMRRQYRMNVLDYLIILRNMVYDPAYAPIREAAKSRSTPVNLHALLKTRAHKAFAVAKYAATHANFDSTPLREWREIVESYPELRVTQLSYMLWRLQNPSFNAGVAYREIMS